jgi:hypothetical protein
MLQIVNQCVINITDSCDLVGVKSTWTFLEYQLSKLALVKKLTEYESPKYILYYSVIF